MIQDIPTLYDRLRTRAETYGIRVREARLGPETAGTFDGLSVTMNDKYDPAERCFYLAHALGSIAQWGRDPKRAQAVFDELRAAKRAKDAGRLARAIHDHRAFEDTSSDYAVWLLADLGRADAIPSYTTFARADIEAVTEFHRRGVAPVWRDFFGRWKEEAARGQRAVQPFTPRPVPAFRPVKIDTQEIIQERDGKP
jgi:hypothetical protein